MIMEGATESIVFSLVPAPYRHPGIPPCTGEMITREIRLGESLHESVVPPFPLGRLVLVPGLVCSWHNGSCNSGLLLF